MTRNGFSQNLWAPIGGPGHWNDPDMLVVGQVGWGPKLHKTQLTPDEQYTHITLWCLLASPLIAGCDMTQMDDLTLSLLTNDEVLAIDQDELGKQATLVRSDPAAGTEIWARDLHDGTIAVGLFYRGRFSLVPPRRNQSIWRLTDRALGQTQTFDNADDAKAAFAKAQSTEPTSITVTWSDLALYGPQPVRDLWHHLDLGRADGKVSINVPFHGAALLKIGTPEETN